MNGIENKLDAFLARNKAQMITDIKTLLNIKSVAAPETGDAPFGEGVKRTLHAALDIAAREGFAVTNMDNRVGYAHAGDENRFIGMMAHMDVVPEGEGWDTDPFCCVEREGFLLARGAEDNKSPFIMSLYAMKFLRECGVPLRYGLRLIAGCDEETGMTDIEHYLAGCPAPAFTIIPDGDFPVGHGEKGIMEAEFVSDTPLSKRVIELAGGVASNVIPEKAHIVLDAALADCPAAENIAVSGRDGQVRIEATGIAGHASRPVGSRNAIIMLYKYLVANALVEGNDRELLQTVIDYLDADYGESLGIACDDGIFTPLTCITGMAAKSADGLLVENVNIRYPTAITGEEITKRLSEKAKSRGFTFNMRRDSKTHFISADNDAVRALTEVFAEVTKLDSTPYVMSGGTYARHIPNAVTYGCRFTNEVMPPFVGTLHGKNEGISVNTIMTATKIYALALLRLQDLEL